MVNYGPGGMEVRGWVEQKEEVGCHEVEGKDRELGQRDSNVLREAGETWAQARPTWASGLGLIACSMHSWAMSSSRGSSWEHGRDTQGSRRRGGGRQGKEKTIPQPQE